MKKIIVLFVILLGFTSCKKDNPDLVIQGKVEGLKKGKIYLQKWNDSTILNIDSIDIYKENHFRFEQNISHPEIMYLQLQKDTIDPTDNYITFFADKGQINIKADLEEFIYAEIKADYANQKEFYAYNETMKRFSDQKLELIKAELEARKSNNKEQLDSINDAYDKMIKRRSLYAINFAIGHPDLEISPYVILEQSKSINPSFLDTVYTKLDQKIQQSYYGLKLKELLKPAVN
jgi:hypothetical protein